MFWPDPTHQPTQYQTIHPAMGGEVSTDFKSSNEIEISQLVQVLLNFDWFQGVVRGCPPTHAHAHTCTHMRVWHHREFPGIPPMGVAICMKLSCLPCMHVHVHVSWGIPQPPPTKFHPPPKHLPPSSTNPPPTPGAAGSQKHQNSITLELIKIIRFCLKILYLWTFLNSYRL